MNTCIVILAFTTCAFATSPPKCTKPQCPADCTISNGADGCPKCDCLDPVTTGAPQIQCSMPKCKDGCKLTTGPEGCPTCTCSTGPPQIQCSTPKCKEGCALTTGTVGCPTCVCPRGRNGNTTCPVIPCPGECSLSMKNGCEQCDCGQGTKSGNGLDKQLGDICLSNTDCAAAYSSCKDNKCTCLNGFKADGATCTTPALQCPTWKGQKSNPGKACVHSVNPATFDETHNCDKTKEFCFVHPKEKTDNGTSVGHCCPKPPKDSAVSLVCPYSGAIDNGTCPDLSSFPADAPIPEGKQRTCSYITSECVHHFKQSICCPLPCSGGSSHFSVNGKCFDYVQIGDVCENDAVCIAGSHCLHVGSGKPLCRCPKKTCNEPSEHCCDA